MKNTLQQFLRLTAVSCAALLLPMMAQAEQAAEQAGEVGGRAMVMEVEAQVTAIDLETRQVTLQGPQGHSFTLTAKEDVVKLEDVSVGDILTATYLAALEGELREPTEEELAQPWLVLEDSGKGVVEGHPMAAEARLIRAVCTIEGMNRLLGTVALMDPNGKVHLITDVEAEKMTGVTLGQTVVVVYREALALSLTHKPAAE